jgi:peroxiredoxin
MTDIAIGLLAPEFTLNDFNGQALKLSDFHGSKHIMLAFLRGFA